ncbi:hypothetical protein [Chryseobacterium chendengshani]|uniref:hypothetical protein n=1 Tax=Chryseobacterium sp. LJ756 TaxID=2864113 RepID=UPI001C63D9B9|nr:hypothetical protein [Chryseobacterium sp. LJ756]MBW7674229.1 hypothetical protein [Chryseobacterium sp. LJ756]
MLILRLNFYGVWNDNIEHFLNVQMKKPYPLQFEEELLKMKIDRFPYACKSFGHSEKR